MVSMLAVPAAWPQSSHDWPSFQGGPTHVAAIGGTALRPGLAIEHAWSVGESSDRHVSTPAIAGGVAVAVGTTFVVGFDPGSGSVTWSIPRAAGTVLMPAIDPASGTAVYAEGNAKGKNALVIVEAKTGTEIGRVSLHQPIRSAPTIADGQVLFGARDQYLYDIDLAGRCVRWRFRTAGMVNGAPAVDGGQVFAISEDGKTGRATLYSLPVGASGCSAGAASAAISPAWTYVPPGIGFNDTAPTVAGGVVYAGFGGTPGEPGSVRAVDERTGALKWHQAVRFAFVSTTAPAVSGRMVYANDLGGGVYAFEASSGVRRWDYAFDSPIQSSAPLIAGNTVYVGLDDGTLVALGTGSGHLEWRGELAGGAAGGLVPQGDAILATTLGRRGRISVLRHDPQAKLLDVPSPTTLHLSRALLNFVGGFAIVIVVLLVLFQFAFRPSRWPWKRGQQPASAQEAVEPDQVGV
jgi:eukaryotic-like serine/threonine-protein kinase